MTTPAPEPPEVEAEELVAAERYLRENVASLSYSTTSRSVHVLLAEYDRMRAELHAREFAASYQAATIGRLRRDRDKLQVDLALALPVVEAAGALVESMHTHICNGNFSQTVTMTGSEPTAVSKKALDALARAVDAGKAQR